MRFATDTDPVPESALSTTQIRSVHRPWLILAFFALAVLFLVFNRGAYRGYFPDDDLDNMGNARGIETHYLFTRLLSPALDDHNFRPAAFSYYVLMNRFAGSGFPKYVGVLHAIHLLNAWLLWCLVRRLGLGAWQSGAAVLFFALHMAAFDAFWKPMYIFDVLCGTFALLTLNAYVRGWPVWAAISFWLAFKCKEVVVLLPFALLAWEWRFGNRSEGRNRWLRLIPLFAISLSFGLQAMLRNPATTGSYHFQLSLGAAWQSLLFYSSQWLLVPKLGLIVFLLFFFTRDSRFRFGMLLFTLLLAPMLFLPDRLFAAYLYVPLIGLSIALASLIRGKFGVALAAVLFLLWLPWDHAVMRTNRKAALAAADEARSWVETAVPWAKAHPEVTTYIYDGAPVNMNPWGLHGALNSLRPGVDPVVVPAAENPIEKFKDKDVGILLWDPDAKKLIILERLAKSSDASYLTIGPSMPFWQFGQGWMAREGRYRWAKPVAVARLTRPEGAREFEAVVNVSPTYLEAVKRPELTILLNGEPVVHHVFAKSGWLTLRWPIPERPAGPVEVEFRTLPVFHPNADDPKIEYGVPFGGFGFVSGTSPAP